jgi:hypothetical protein
VVDRENGIADNQESFSCVAYHLNGNGADTVMAIDEGQSPATGSSCPISEIVLELKHGGPNSRWNPSEGVVPRSMIRPIT